LGIKGLFVDDLSWLKIMGIGNWLLINYISQFGKLSIKKCSQSEILFKL
jgi:hypothetical protein